MFLCESFNNGETWLKKSNKGAFDFQQGSFDGAEVSKLMGLYILNKINEIVNIVKHDL